MPRSKDVDSSFLAATRPWHAQTQEMIFRELVAGTNGMDGAETVRQKEQCGPNRLPEPPPRGPLISLLANLHNLLMHLLFGAVLLAVPTVVALRKWRPKHDGPRGSSTGSAAG